MTHCECCDHPLQHAIRAALAMDRAPIPYAGRTHQTIMANLEMALDEWEENQ